MASRFITGKSYDWGFSFEINLAKFGAIVARQVRLEERQSRQLAAIADEAALRTDSGIGSGEEAAESLNGRRKSKPVR